MGPAASAGETARRRVVPEGEMGNFEKLSVLVIVVIIVMILVVALYTWTDNPGEKATTSASRDITDVVKPEPPDMGPTDVPQPPAPPITRGVPDPAPAPVPPAPEPPKEPTTWMYGVKAGDSLGGIAQKELASFKRWTEIEALNPGIADTPLRVGDQLKMPPKDGALPPDAAHKPPDVGAKPVASVDAPKPGGKYVVQKKDTLETIAQRAYGAKSRWPEIYVKNLGRMRSAKDLPEGMTIFIPE